MPAPVNCALVCLHLQQVCVCVCPARARVRVRPPSIISTAVSGSRQPTACIQMMSKGGKRAKALLIKADVTKISLINRATYCRLTGEQIAPLHYETLPEGGDLSADDPCLIHFRSGWRGREKKLSDSAQCVCLFFPPLLLWRLLKKNRASHSSEELRAMI